MDHSDRVIVALDVETVAEALALAEPLRGRAHMLKVGMTLFYSEGPAAVAALRELGFEVFLDLKLHDIPHQVRRACSSVASLGASMLTVHASGGAAMVRAAREGLETASSETGLERPKLLAVTVLTSLDDRALAEVGVEGGSARQVDRLARIAVANGADGVVCSAMEAMVVSRAVPGALIVTPGVRPGGAAAQDQARVATPSEAFANGATHIVVGRPITEAADPGSAFEEILREIGDGSAGR